MKVALGFVSESMANVVSERTGLAETVFISSKSNNKKGFARIKVNDTPAQAFDKQRCFEVLFNETTYPFARISQRKSHVTAKELQRIFEWVEKNKGVLLDYWYEREVDTLAVLTKLQKV